MGYVLYIYLIETILLCGCSAILPAPSGHSAQDNFGDVLSAMALGDDIPSLDRGDEESLFEGEIGPSPSESVLGCQHQKHLPPLDWEEINFLYNDWSLKQTNVPQISTTTVKLRWRQAWQKKLPFRQSKGQHAVCTVCVEYKQWRKRAVQDSPECVAATNGWVQHMADQKCDRVVGDNIAKYASDNFTVREAKLDPTKDVLNSTIDAVEQAKFKVPKLEAGDVSKDVAGKWRPQLHVTGMVIDGVQEQWYVSSCTLPKNANTQCTYLADGMDAAASICCEILRPMPRMFRVSSDNASGETKNQIVFKLLAWCVYKELFDVAEAAQQRAGHSHNRQDQRFAAALPSIKHSRNLPLQDDVDFAKVLRDEVRPIPGLRAHRVCVVTAAWDFTSFFAELNVNIEGHTSTKAKKEAGITPPHVFRFLLRCKLTDHCFKEAAVWTGDLVTMWPSIPPHPHDVICMTKRYIASPALSQAPFVFCPAEFMNKLDISQLRHAASVPLAPTHRKELLKSANFFAAPPRLLDKTDGYLKWLCECDGSVIGTPPPLKFIRGQLDSSWLAGHSEIDVDDLFREDDVRVPDGLEGFPGYEKLRRMGDPDASCVTARPAKKAKRAIAAGVSAASAGAPAQSFEPMAPANSGVTRTVKTKAAPDTRQQLQHVYNQPHLPSALPAAEEPAVEDHAEVELPSGDEDHVELPPDDDEPPIGERRRSKNAVTFLSPRNSLGILGCSKCQRSLNGCGACRVKAGWVPTDAAKKTWGHKPSE